VSFLRKNTMILAALTCLSLVPGRLFAQTVDLNNEPVGNLPVVTELYNFVYDGIGVSGYSHGKNLYSELIQGADGNFYGTTLNGGSGGLCRWFWHRGLWHHLQTHASRGADRPFQLPLRLNY